MFEGVNLFWGALLDALIGPNFFVPGEPFFIAAGYQLHNGIWLAVVAVMLGGLLGDQLSYLIGYKVGNKAQRKLIRVIPKSRRAIARCRYLMTKKGAYVIAFARLLGPIAWVVPFIAGTNKTPWAKFSLLASLGLLIGGGQFIFWGFILAYGIEQVPMLYDAKVFIIEHQYTLLSLAATAVIGVIGYKYRWQKLPLKVVMIFLMSQLATNYSHFFWFADDFKEPQASILVTSSNKVTDKESYKAYAGKSSFFDAQAVNVMFIGESPKAMMKALGWIENQTFSRDEIEWKDYLVLLKRNTPPVSDLFWQQRPQDMAFQLPGNLIQRSHIRWWKADSLDKSGSPIWMGAISYDNGLKITPYSGIITVLHSINPNVDKERDKLASMITSHLLHLEANIQPLTQAVAIDEAHDYYTDGSVLVVSKQKELKIIALASSGNAPL
mgnify:CR=1 FL=1